MTNLHRVISGSLKGLIVLLMAAIVVIVCMQVFSRFILDSSSSFTEELARFLLIWIGLFGAAYGYQVNAHLGLDIVTNKLTGAVKQSVAVISHIVVIVFAVWVMIIGGISLVSLTLEPVQISAAMGLKMAYVYAAIPLSGVLITYFGIIKIYHLLTNTADQTDQAEEA